MSEQNKAIQKFSIELCECRGDYKGDGIGLYERTSNSIVCSKCGKRPYEIPSEIPSDVYAVVMAHQKSGVDYFTYQSVLEPVNNEREE